MATPSLQQSVEALVFAADNPVPPHRIVDVVADVNGPPRPSIDAIEAAVDQLNAEYAATGRAFRIQRWAGGFRMATDPSVDAFVRRLFVQEQETTLSRSLLETLVVVAYRQPATRSEVEFVRGVNSEYALRKLLDLRLIDVNGRADAIGRPLLYGTTARFLEQFGLNTLHDLPTLRDVRDLLDDPDFEEERAELLQLNMEDQGNGLEAAATEEAATDATRDTAGERSAESSGEHQR